MVGESKVIWNPYSLGYFENPYSHLKECREQNPIHIGIHKSWVFFEYNTVNSILRSPAHEAFNLTNYLSEKEPYIFRDSNACPFLSKGTKLWTMYLNGDIHKQVRLAMGKAINSLPLEKIIKESLDEHHVKYSNVDTLDLVDYCAQFIFLVTKKLFGITNNASLEKIKQYSNSLAKSQDLFVPKQIYLDINDDFLWGKNIFFNSPYREQLSAFLGDIAADEDDLYSLMAVTLMASFETSKDNLSLALLEVINSADISNSIENSTIEELNLIIEEFFRFTSPLQYTVRINKEPLRFQETVIEANSKLYLCLASANRDPSVFENPNEICVSRNPNPHLAFGGGVHFCLGSTIARQEMRHCLKPMARFLKQYKRDESQKIEWSKQIFMRTAKSILIEKI